MLRRVRVSQVPPGFGSQDASDKFVYEAAKAKFSPAKLSKSERIILDALRGLGATHFRVRYDGGYDEGFSHPEYLAFGKKQRPVKEVAAELAKSPMVDQIRKAAEKEPYNPYQDRPDNLVANTRSTRWHTNFASKLLGNGYGAGDYQLYGAFTADLTGEIVDDPTAPQPENM